MRVGFDARWYNDSGVGTYVAELLKALASLQTGSTKQAGFELVVYEDPANPVPGLENSVERIPLRAGKYSPHSQVALRQCCRRDRLDLLHSPFYPIPLRVSCPVVVTLHDLIPFLFPVNRLKQSVIKSGYKVAASRSSHIIAVSHHTAEDIKKILRVPPEKISVIHNGVSAVDFHASGSSTEPAYLRDRYGIQPPYVLVGSAHNWRTKNLVSALRALALAQEDRAAHFQTVIYGPPDGFQAAGGQNAWRQLHPVETGHLAAADLGCLFRHAHLLVLPSLYEGFGLALLEAMSCGCAVITSNAGSLPEVAGEGAQTFDPLDVSGMADAVGRLLANPDELKRWRQRALLRAADFSWTKAARETLAVYHRASKTAVI